MSGGWYPDGLTRLARRHARKSSLRASIVAGSLSLGSGAAFGQGAAPLALREQAPVDEDAGIRVPEGFDARVFAEGIGRARHIVVRDNGDVYVALRRLTEGSGIAALRDEDGDGAADRIAYFGEHAGTGIAIRGGFLYASSDDAIYRYPLPDDGALLPESGRSPWSRAFRSSAATPRRRSRSSPAMRVLPNYHLRFTNPGRDPQTVPLR